MITNSVSFNSILSTFISTDAVLVEHVFGEFSTLYASACVHVITSPTQLGGAAAILSSSYLFFIC